MKKIVWSCNFNHYNLDTKLNVPTNNDRDFEKKDIYLTPYNQESIHLGDLVASIS